MDALCPRLVCLRCSSSPSECYTSVWVVDKETQTGSLLHLKIIDCRIKYVTSEVVFALCHPQDYFIFLYIVSFLNRILYIMDISCEVVIGKQRVCELAMWSKKQFPSCGPGSYSAPSTASSESLLWPFSLPINLLSDCSGQLTLC